MAATAIWKSFHLEEEYRRLMGDRASTLESYPSGEGRRVIAATNVFASDPYALPHGTDAKVRELYPSLVELSRESCYVSEVSLEKMATELRSSSAYVPSVIAARSLPPIEPFVMASPVVTRRMRPEPRLSARQEHQTVIRPDYLRSDTGRLPGARVSDVLNESVDRFATNNTTLVGNGNIFDSDSYRRGGLGSTILPNDQSTLTPVRPQRSQFNFQKEFLSAFQPGVESGNDYGALETPVVERATSNNQTMNVDTLVSPFPWEKSANLARTQDFGYTPRGRTGEASEQKYPSYLSGDANRTSGSVVRPLRRIEDPISLFDSIRPRMMSGTATHGGRDSATAGFSLRSPIRSLMRDSDHSYGYKNSHTTPRSLYHNLL
ncbi:phosphoglucomutase, putative [Babesia ovata]|uniref:Phosphoglucomutase, putative n=1 Tax=Babesia ovata TaxID=189622 RepID=A0A2H6K7D8_9APIC|nr:phosphoglucomutase, putative [Babesia ovata]GBE58916.1 phosphoglucomutase, putative [Babesia ovata]